MQSVSRLNVRVLSWPARSSQWNYTGHCGALCLIAYKNTNVLKIFDLEHFREVFAQEIYDGFQYDAPRPFFHTFSGDRFVCGMSFASEDEARLAART